jgi:hypothetical protein
MVPAPGQSAEAGELGTLRSSLNESGHVCVRSGSLLTDGKGEHVVPPIEVFGGRWQSTSAPSSNIGPSTSSMTSLR